MVLLSALFGAAASAWALFAGRYLPSIDLSNHLALISALAHGGETGATDYIERVFAPSPYLLFYAVTALFGQLVPVDVAAKLAFALSGSLLSLSAACLADATGRDPRLGALAPLALFSLSFGWGFASFVFSTPLFFFALAAHERLVAPAEDLTRREGLMALGAYALWVMLVFNGHGLLALALAFLVATRATSLSIAGLVRTRSRRALRPFALAAVGALPAAISMVPLIIGLERNPWREAGTRIEDAKLFIFEPLSRHLEGIGGNLLERGSPNHWLVMWGAVAWFGLALFLSIVAGALRREAPPNDRRSLGLETYALGLLVIYLAGPISVGAPVSAWLVYPRFGVLAGVALSILPRLSLRSWFGWLLIPAAFVLVGANAELNARHIRNFSNLAAHYDPVRRAIPPKTRVLALTVVPQGDFTNQHPALGSLYFYHMVDGASVTAYLFQMPVLPARVRVDHAPRAPFWKTPHLYEPRVHGVDFDYLVLRGPEIVERTRRAQLHDLVTEIDGWFVFKTKNPTPRPKD
ncbi:MAG: hypothetical protein HY791_29605 [Deltaproteobacteria bacterium]|nr:hypothetical protein [Deltaproteobacteria bacterium]